MKGPTEVERPEDLGKTTDFICVVEERVSRPGDAHEATPPSPRLLHSLAVQDISVGLN